MWWAENWGNLASVLGLVVSVLVWLKARTVQKSLERFRNRRRHLELLLACERARSTANRLQDATGNHLPRRVCDELHRELVALQHADAFRMEQRRTLRKFVAGFRQAPKNTEDTQAELRQLAELLDVIRVVLHKQVEDHFDA